MLFPRPLRMLVILRDSRSVTHRPSQLASAYPGHLLSRLSSSAANQATDQGHSDTPQKVPFSKTKEYRTAYRQKLKDSNLSNFQEANRSAARKHYYKNKEALNAKKQEWRAENADHLRTYSQQYYQRNIEAELAHAREYRLKNAETIAAKQRARYWDSPERIQAREMRDEAKVQRQEQQAERDRKRIEQKAARERRLEEQRRRIEQNAILKRHLREERASIDSERVTRLAEKKLSIKKRIYLLRQLARLRTLQASKSNRGP